VEYITQIMDMTGYTIKLRLIQSNHGYDKLGYETQVNPVCFFLNIKKIILNFFKVKSHFLLVLWVISGPAKSTR